MQKQTRAIAEDLLPLYAEGLLSEETTTWLEEQLRADEELRQLADETAAPLEPVPIEATVDYEQMMRKIRRKLSLYQLVFIALSFFLAIQTSMLNNSFGFVLWYAVLGVLTYLFYKDMKIVFYISFIPIFIWSIWDFMSAYAEGHVSGISLIGYAFEALWGSVMVALIHYVFAFIGSIVGLLIDKLKEKG